MTARKTYAYEAYFREIAERLKRNVRYRREKLGLTVHEAAQRSDMHPRHWQKIEDGTIKPDLSTMARLAGSLEIDLADLIGSELSKNPEESSRENSNKE